MMQLVRKFTSPSQKTGEFAEKLATLYLMERGFTILERNYTQKWGEIDIIAKKGKIVHFVEVKSVSRENYATFAGDGARPEDQMHARKQARLIRTIKTYLSSHDVSDWQFDLLSLYLDQTQRKAYVRPLYDIILSEH